MAAITEKKIDMDSAGIRRRDFIHIAPVSFAAVGVAASAIPLVDSMNPSADVLAVSVIEVDLSSIEPGQRITVSWRNQPIFIVRIPLGQKEGDPLGKYGGWFCPCHGSLYDASGRVRRGPAPRNLDIPPYVFLNDTKIRIG